MQCTMSMSPFQLFSVVVPIIVITLLYFVKKYFGSTKIYKGDAKLNGKTVVITGGNSGIGKETALDLARRGAKIILACRNESKAKDAVEDIKVQTGNDAVEYRHLDLSDLDSVRSFAKTLIDSEPHIDILINNAGVGNRARCLSGPVTKQNFDLVFGTNYIGPFLLTYLLLESLKSAPEGARIINVSSLMNWFNWKQLRFDKTVHSNGIKYPQFSGYKLSKMANIMHARELTKRLAGFNVTANSVHPGLVRTDIFNPHSESYLSKTVTRIEKFFVRNFGLDPKDGAQTTIFLAVDESVKFMSGKYFDKLEIATANPLTNDDKACKELWEHSIKMCGL